MQNFKNGKVPVADNKASSLMKMAEMELSDLYQKSELETIGFWLLEHFVHISQSNYLRYPDVNVDQSSLIHFCNAVEKLKEGMPVQYVIGEVDFYGLKLKVNNSVLIPRPETEELVDLIVKENKERSGLKILDVGTGSGCIGLSLAKSLSSSLVTAIDVSTQALEIASENAIKNKIKNIEFTEMDFLKEKFPLGKEFDLIVSNPPYISQSESAGMADHVLKFEPHLALFVPDENSLVFYKKIAGLADENLKNKGTIYLEINERLGSETASVFGADRFSSVEIIKDMFGKNRFIKTVRL